MLKKPGFFKSGFFYEIFYIFTKKPYVKNLFAFLLLSICIQSCIVNSTITDVPLIKEKGQKELSVGISGPIPGARISYAYGLTDKYYLQTVGDISFISAQIQQSFGMYKQLDDRRYREKSFGYLIGEGAMFNFGGESSMYGTYNLWFTNFTLAKTLEKHPRITTGLCFKPGFLYLNYVLGHDVYDETDTSDYPFKWERLTNQKYYQIYYSQQFFLKADLLQMKLGFYAQIHGGWGFFKNGNHPYLWPANIGISYQYKKADKQAVKEKRVERELKYDYKHVIAISGNFNNNPHFSTYNTIWEQDLKVQIPRILLSYQYQLQYWLSVKSTIGYYKYTGYANVYDKWEDKNYHINYKYVEPILQISSNIHWYNSPKFELHTGLGINPFFPFVKYTQFCLDSGSSADRKTGTIHYNDSRYKWIPLGFTYTIKKPFGIQVEYNTIGLLDHIHLQNFIFGLNAKF